MPESMAAVVNHGPGDYRLDEVPRPHALYTDLRERFAALARRR